MSATLLAGALALAGCGGSSNGEGMVDDMDDMLTPEEQCDAENGEFVDGECKSAADLQAELDAKEKADADEKAAADAKMAQVDAAALRAALAKAIGGDVDVSTTANPGNDYFVTVAAAGPSGLKDNDAYKDMVVSVAGKTFSKQYPSISNGVVTLVTDGTPQADFPSSRIKVAAFGTSGQKTHTANGVNSRGAARFTTSGSYHGVDGTNTCTGTCTSNWNDSDALQLGGTWAFMPSDPNGNVMDGSAVQYGWWTNDLGKSSAVARVYYGPKDMSAYTDFAGGGTATYKGDAVGQYAIHRGAGADNDSGAFTANATLNADFGGNDAEISGMIDGFMGADGVARDWTVTLGAATIADGVWKPAITPGNSADLEAMTVWTMDGAKGSAAGGWSGAFYGLSGRGTAVTPAAAAAAGAFSAEHGNIGNMIGAFGAEKE